MVNPGHPSKGCRTCKMRRIKCDEAQPICRKCTTSNRICLGYNEPPSATKQKFPLSTEHIQDVAIFQSKGNFRRLAARPSSSKDDSHHDLPTSTNDPQQRIPSTRSSPLEAVNSAIDACFKSLQNDIAQTVQQRKDLHGKYQLAIQNLRSTILSTSSSPSANSTLAAYYFALYEMSVSLSSTDRTWHAHLDGFLALLRHKPQPQSQQSSMFSHIITALQFVDSPSPVAISAEQLVTISLLRLRSLVRELRALNSGRPRQLDLLKHRVQLKKVYNDLQLLSSSSSVEKEGSGDMTCKALIITTGKILVRLGQILHPSSWSQAFETTRGYAKLTRAINDAGEDIYMVTRKWCKSDRDTGSSGMGMVKMIWPLYAAYLATIGIQEQNGSRSEIQALLTRIGEETRMPVALGLASRDYGHDEEYEYSQYEDIICGLVLVQAVDSDCGFRLEGKND